MCAAATDEESMIRVLCVDDEPYIRDICRIFLCSQGDIQVDTADSAEAALEMHAREQYDAIVSDYLMAGMDGIDLLRHLRTKGDDTPFIIFTGKGREEVAIQALNAGADFYIQKGGDPKAQFVELTHKIRHAVARKRAERAAVTAATVWERTFDAVPDMIALIDCEYRIMRVNAALASRTGSSPDALRGRRCYEVFHAKDSPPPECPLERILRENVSKGSETFGEVRIPHLGGVFEVSISPLTDESGKTIGLIHVLHEITGKWQAEQKLKQEHEELLKTYERLVLYEEELHQSYEKLKKNQDALQEREVLYRTIFENTGTATVLIEEDTTISLANSEFERLAGLPREEIEGRKSWTAFVAKEDLEWMREQHRLRREDPGKAMRHYEFRFVRVDGETRHIYLTIELIPGTKKSIASLQDITELERSMEELRRKHEKLVRVEEELRQSYTALVKSQLALQEQEKSLSILIRALPDLVIRSDRGGRISYVSACIGDHLGLEPDECLGRQISELPLPSAFTFPLDAAIHDAISKAKSVEMELKLEQGRGSKIYDVRVIPELDEEGGIFGGFVLCRDLTAHRLTELHYRTLFQEMMDAFAIHEILLSEEGTPIDYRFLAVNPSFERMTGLRAEEIVGKTVREVIPGIEPEWIQRYGRVALTGRPEHFVSYSRPLGKYFEVNAFSIIPGQFACTFRDITESLKAEEALRESEAFNRTLVDNLPDYVVVYGEGGRIMYANPSLESAMKRLGDGILGKNILSVVLEEDRDRVRSMLEERLAGKEIPPYELQIRTPNGEKMALLVKGAPIRFGGARAALLLLTDITELKRLEKEATTKAEELKRISNSLELTNKKLKLLYSLTRHEISNQLQILSGYLGILKDRIPDPAAQGLMDRMIGAADSIKQTVQFTSRYESIGIKAPVWHNVHEIVREAGKEAQIAGIALENLVPERIEIFADPLVSRVFLDLVENAVRHGMKVSRIRFGIQEKENELVIYCEDDGIGVPVQDKERIFERGYGNHTGLGLYLARETLAITGMGIRETGKEGEGARFEIIVPKGAYRAG